MSQPTTEPTYEQVQKAACTILGMLGMRFPLKTRLPIFRLTSKLDKDYPSRPEANEARKLLARLLILRTKGLEPRHANGQYL